MFLFFLFCAGVLCVIVGKRCVPEYSAALEARLTFHCLPAVVLLALFLGSTVFGRYLIPPLTLLCGAAVCLLSGQLLDSGAERSSLVSLFLIVPAFFVIAVLGMRNSANLQRALRLYSRPEIQQTVIALLLRIAVSAVCVLGFSLLNR